MPVVYQITSPSGKSYIGVAKRSAHERFKKHANDARTGRKTALCGAIRKYGADAMKVVTLIESTSEYCFDLEVRVISKFGTLHPNGYNLTTGGEGIHEMADVAKAKHLASMRDPARIEAIGKASKEFNSRPEIREKKSLLMKARWATKEWRDHMDMIVKSKRPAKVVEQVSKSCNFCHFSFECAKNVSSRRIYCCMKCAQAAGYLARKASSKRY